MYSTLFYVNETAQHARVHYKHDSFLKLLPNVIVSKTFEITITGKGLGNFRYVLL